MIEIVAVLGAVVAVVLGIAFLFTVIGTWNAFVIYKLWAWLIVPIFGLHALTIWQAFALSIFVNTLWYHNQTSSGTKKTRSETISGLLTPFVSGALALLAGWLLRGHV